MNNINFKVRRTLSGVVIIVNTPNWGEKKFGKWLHHHFPKRHIFRAIAARGLMTDSIRQSVNAHSGVYACWGAPGTYQVFLT